VDEGQDGLLVPFGDVTALAQAIERLLSDTALAKRLGERGQEKVRLDYTWDRVGDRVLDHYRALVAAAER
jgi:glycosyltransferase involved in cell wall biosynthesis